MTKMNLLLVLALSLVVGIGSLGLGFVARQTNNAPLVPQIVPPKSDPKLLLAGAVVGEALEQQRQQAVAQVTQKRTEISDSLQVFGFDDAKVKEFFSLATDEQKAAQANTLVAEQTKAKTDEIGSAKTLKGHELTPPELKAEADLLALIRPKQEKFYVEDPKGKKIDFDWNGNKGVWISKDWMDEEPLPPWQPTAAKLPLGVKLQCRNPKADELEAIVPTEGELLKLADGKTVEWVKGKWGEFKSKAENLGKMREEIAAQINNSGRPKVEKDRLSRNMQATMTVRNLAELKAALGDDAIFNAAQAALRGAEKSKEARYRWVLDSPLQP